MRRLVYSAVGDHPIQLAELVLRQWSDYLNPVLAIHDHYWGALSGAVPSSPGDKRVIIPDNILRTFAAWNIRPTLTSASPTTPSPALWYFESAGGVWSVVLAYYATFGIFLVPFVRRKGRRTFLIFATSFSFFYMASIAVAANQLVTRYLLPLDVPLLYSVALCLPARKFPHATLAEAHRPPDTACLAPEGQA
jgi:hypothetical protein